MDNIDIGKFTIAFVDSALDFLERRDRYTAQHCIGVGLLAGRLGKALGFDKQSIAELELAGRAHDIGKIAWKDDCFGGQKEGELGNLYDRMFDHPTLSKAFLYDPLKVLHANNPTCELKWLYWVWFHHWGFRNEYRKNPPLDDDGVKEITECLEKCQHKITIELGIGVMHVADSLHAGISGRPYRSDPAPKSIDKILKELEEKMDDEYHPQVVKAVKDIEPWLKNYFIPKIFYNE
jgi:HD-GYP domain-containing protein (c-di-GMP phosphodiesterase class II)